MILSERLRLGNLAKFSSSKSFKGYFSDYLYQNPRSDTDYRRFVAFGNYNGASSLGWMVLDWDYAWERFVVTGFNNTFSWWDFNPLYGAQGTLTSETEILLVGSDPKTGIDDLEAARITLSAYPDSTFTFNTAFRNIGSSGVKRADIAHGCAGDQNFGLVFGFYDGNSWPDGHPSSNIYLGSVPSSVSSYSKVGPFRTGLTGGVQGGALCQIGNEGVSRFIVNQYAYNNDGNTVYWKLSSTSSILATASFSGFSNYMRPIKVSSTAAVVADYHNNSYNGKLTLLYTNSATNPTSLSAGGSVFAPDIPEINPSHIDFKYPGSWTGAFNQKYKDNTALILGTYKIDVPYTHLYGFPENQYSYSYFYVPFKLTVSGTSLSITRLEYDIDGNYIEPIPLMDEDGDNIANYNMSVIAAPDDKAVLFYHYGFVNDKPMHQIVFQL